MAPPATFILIFIFMMIHPSATSGHPISEKYLLHFLFNLLVAEMALVWIIRKMKMTMKVAGQWESQSQKKKVSESVLKPTLKCTA